jgi:thiol-disulfide isomerase/thioredoxin
MRPAALAAIVVGSAAAGAAFFLYQQRREQAEAPPLATQAPVAALVDTVPQFRLADRDGTPRSLADWDGKARIVNFWATWCAPCRREIPLLKKLQRDHGAEGFQVVGIAVDFRDKVLAYAEEMQIDYPILIGEQDALDAAAAFGIDVIGFPFTIFTDTKGRVVAAHMGELTEPEAALILGAVRRVDAGLVSPLQARSEITAGLPALQHEAPAED